MFAPSLAKSGRPILALDGCPLECVKNCLAVHNVVPAQHIMLNELGVKKRQQTDFDLDEANAAFFKIVVAQSCFKQPLSAPARVSRAAPDLASRHR
ncbi:putative zinc-binding protein [Aeromonas allosaccharophila]|uniref:putative zinc-binding protein n=1 Tax=Aeromonas allosaccharophila TaxID=656 RepID=UPI003BA39C05